jgi:hypothetical protein
MKIELENLVTQYSIKISECDEELENLKEFDSDMVSSSIGILSARRKAYFEVIEDLNYLIPKE